MTNLLCLAPATTLAKDAEARAAILNASLTHCINLAVRDPGVSLEDEAAPAQVRCGFPSMRGGHEAFRLFSDDLEFPNSNGINLYKLGGSIDWWDYDVSYAVNAGLFRILLRGECDSAFHDYRSKSQVLFQPGEHSSHLALQRMLWALLLIEARRVDRVVLLAGNSHDLELNHLIRRSVSDTTSPTEVVLVGEVDHIFRDTDDPLCPIDCPVFSTTMINLMDALTADVRSLRQLV